MQRVSTAACLGIVVVAATGRAAATNEQSAPVTSPAVVGKQSTEAPTGQNPTAAATNGVVTLPAVTVTADLDRARDQIAPSLGAVTYTIGPNQIQALPQGETRPLARFCCVRQGWWRIPLGKCMCGENMAT